MAAAAGEAGWNGFYHTAGTGMALSVGLILLDFAMTFQGGDVATGTLTAEAWFAFFQQAPFVGLRNFGLFNLINPLLVLPLYLALCHLHRRTLPAGAALALALFVLGSGVYIANNRAFAMLELSQQYAAAGSDSQRALLAAAGTALMAQAEDFTPGSFPGFLLSSLGNLAMIVVMLRGGVFARRLSLLGLAGSALLLGFTVTITFLPALFDLAMPAALLGGLLMLAWNIWIAVAMFRRGQRPARCADLAAVQTSPTAASR